LIHHILNDLNVGLTFIPTTTTQNEIDRKKYQYCCCDFHLELRPFYFRSTQLAKKVFDSFFIVTSVIRRNKNRKFVRSQCWINYWRIHFRNSTSIEQSRHTG